MGGLALAGAIGGMGQGLERGLQQVTAGIIQQGLSDADRKFQSEKLALQMEHAERLQQGTIAANAANAQLQAGTHIATTGMQAAAHERDTAATIAANKENAQTQAGTHIVTTGQQTASHEKIAEATNAANKEIAKWHAARDTKAAKSIELKETRALLNDLRDSRDRLVKEIGNPMADPKDKERNLLDLKDIDSKLSYYQDIFDNALGTPLPAKKAEATPSGLRNPNLSRTPVGATQNAAPVAPPRRSNVIVEGKKELAAVEAALNEAKRVGNTTAAIGLQKKYDELFQRWGGAGE